MSEPMRWQPIKTAPKDHAILLRVPEAISVGAPPRKVTDVQIGWWDDEHSRWVMCDTQAGGYVEVQPTHWFDIPADDEGFA